MLFETALNVLWVLLGLAALGWLGWSEFSRRSSTSPRARLWRVFSVLLAILFLFPCVSASDDAISISHWLFDLETRGEVGTPPSHQSDDGKPAGTYLARLFETLQSFQIPSQYLLLLAYGFFALTVSRSRLAQERYLLSLPGRAPPLY